jgi:hypothetical protein
MPTYREGNGDRKNILGWELTDLLVSSNEAARIGILLYSWGNSSSISSGDVEEFFLLDNNAV